MNLEPEVLIIGAGQAGLALGHHLRRGPLSFQMVEAHPRLGDNWRRRYDSLTLFTPRAYSSLPGLALPGDPEGYASRDEFAAYLEGYAEHFSLPVAAGVNIQRLERGPGSYRARTADGRVLRPRSVVLATGAFQRPAVPALARQFAPAVAQFTSESYRNPEQVPAGAVLVVGDGATGRDIAAELAAAHAVWLAVGRPRRVVPERVLGRNVFWWLDRLGLLRAPAGSLAGRIIQKTDPFPARGKELWRLRQRGVRVVGRLAGASGTQAAFAGGETMEVRSVVWAVGYRDDSDWVALPEVKDSAGRFRHAQGVAPAPGLYFIGRPWQRSRGSAFIGGVGRDAALLAERIAADRAAATRQPLLRISA